MADENGLGESQENQDDGAFLEDGTLGGYQAHHNRPPAFEGMDGSAYTVSIEVEKTGDLNAPFSGYLVFPRWADTGAGIVGHLETPTLATGKTQDEVEKTLGALTLHEVNRFLAEAIIRRTDEIE